MFGQRSFVLLVAFATLVGIALAERYVIKGDFVERRKEWEFGFLKGSFYYLYDSEMASVCRLRFEYSLDYLGGNVITNVYNYEDGAMYSMNETKNAQNEIKCTGMMIDEKPDPWWIVGDLFEETSEEEGGKVWYARNPSDVNSSTQVMRILMDRDSDHPVDGYLAAINFYDGRNITFKNVVVDNTITPESPIFEKPAECPSPTCPIYADIVFVLDASGSVTHIEWNQTVQFVVEVMNSFTFGKNAVAAAALQFNGQDSKTFKKTIKDPICGKIQRYEKDLELNRKINDPDLMASPKASADYGEGPTVSTNKDELIRELKNTIIDHCVYPNSDPKNMVPEHCQAFPGWRGTNQALGLKLAMEFLDRSPRRNYKAKPNNIVIVVTDGEDKNPNSTARNATLLQQPPYNALVVEVGVGLECEYDRNYLESIASPLYDSEGNKKPAYFAATDYDAIKRIADELFRPLCNSNFSAECGPDCKGFCGAGQCLCPDCDDSDDVCHFVKCNVSGSFSDGCVRYDSATPIPDDICTTHQCDPEMVNPGSKKGGWLDIPNDCEDKKREYPGTCRRVGCNLGFGGCRVELDDAYCSSFARSSCEEWECSPLDVKAEDLEDPESGCRLKYNHTKHCEDELHEDGRDNCMRIECVAGSSSATNCKDMTFDKCSVNDNACHKYKCLNTFGNYQCEDVMYIPQNDFCVTWKCDETEGWVHDKVQTEETCKNAFKAYKSDHPDFIMDCKSFYCNPTANAGYEGIETGCNFTVKDKSICSTDCSDDDSENCFQSGSNIDDKECVYGFCEPVQQLDGNWLPTCFRSDSVNCLAKDSEAAQEAKKLNENNPKVCFTPVCGGNGKCTVEKIPLPSNFIATNCTEPRCIPSDEDGSWRWEMLPTEIANSCHTDACFIRECVDDIGCVANENCSIYTNECYSYSCVNVEGTPKCQMKDLTVDFLDLECMYETCVNGKKEVRSRPVEESCSLLRDAKCLKATCVEGYCKYEDAAPPGDDLCEIYTCDNSTGNWSIEPKCDDHLFCTIDECWNYGYMSECHHEPVECSNYLDMEGFKCFRPFCKENDNEFRCVRKLLPNAYVDVCGNCISENPYDTEDYYSESHTDSGSDILLSCTHAPPKPIMVETLAAATIALIIVAAVIAGSIVGTSGVIGTKALIDFAKTAHNQSAQTNPLYEGAESEMMNPTYGGGDK